MRGPRPGLIRLQGVSDIKVAVIGASGRMGSQVCAAADAADGLTLVGRFDHGDDLGDLGGADVAVEFTVPDASPANVAHCVDRGVHVVVGTTGWDDERVEVPACGVEPVERREERPGHR